MITPNGRFSVNTRLCLSLSDFHPESWNPLWSVSSIVSGVRSFLVENEPTYGSITTSDAQRVQFARDSHAFNRRNAIFAQLFPHLMQPKTATAPAPTSSSAKGAWLLLPTSTQRPLFNLLPFPLSFLCRRENTCSWLCHRNRIFCHSNCCRSGGRNATCSRCCSCHSHYRNRPRTCNCQGMWVVCGAAAPCSRAFCDRMSSPSSPCAASA
jgi:hypothetical protein